MIINCNNCNKNFEIDQNLIPAEGRLVQCGSCNHKWFFKTNIPNKEEDKTEKVFEKKDAEEIIHETNEETKDIVIENIDDLDKDKIETKDKKKKNINYFNLFLVSIITLIAIVILLDTFKSQLTSILPDLDILLDNLYQSLEDIKLFILDLIK